MLPKFVTQEMTLKDVFSKLKEAYPESFDGLCTEYDLKEETPYIRKGVTASDLKFEEGERAVISNITTDSVDRDGEIVDPKGVILTDYEKNPVVLFGHDHRNLPIGRNMWIKRSKNGLIAKTTYATHQLANDVYEYRKGGFPLAQSIGFIPLKVENYAEGSEERKQGVYRKYTKWLLLEYSDVPVPSNPDAVAIAISKGLIPNNLPESAPQEEVNQEEKEDESSSLKSETSNDSKEEKTDNILEQTEIKSEDSSSNKEEFIIKLADLNENPSVWDIVESLQSLVRVPMGSNLPYKWVCDVYPIKYPNGHCIINIESKEGSKYYQHDYTYSEEGSTISEEFTELERGYQSKKSSKDIEEYIRGKKSEGDSFYILAEEEIVNKEKSETFTIDSELLNTIVKNAVDKFKKEIIESCVSEVKDEFARMRGKV